MQLPAEFSAFLDILLQIAAPILTTALVGVAITFGLKLYAEAKNAAGDNWFFVEQAARTAVQAAEQSGLAGLIAKTGAEKKAYALDALDNFLKQKGVKLNLKALDSLVEAAVNDAFGKPRA